MHKEGANRYNMQKNFQESFYEFFQKENAGRDDMPVWQCYKRLDEIGRKKKILNNSLFETDDVGQLLQIKQIVVNSFFFRKRKLFIYAIDLYIQYISGIKNNKEPIEQINDRSEQKKMLPQKEEPEDIEIEQERSGGEESSRDRKESYEEERQDNGQEEDADEDISEKLKKVETGQALVEKTVNDEETNDIQERMTDKKGGAMIEKKNTWTEKDRELFAKYEQKYEQVRDALERMSESQKEGVPLFDLWMSFQYTIPYSNVKAIVNNASWAQKDCHSYYYKPIDKANDAVVIKKGPILWGQDAKGAKERSRSWRTGETRVDVAKNDAQAPAASKRDKEQEETESKKKAIQPKWDKYEAALLVEACLKVKGGVSRNEVVSELSQTLRRLAAVRGLQIDEVYRNTVGIHWQMLSMQYVLRGDIYKAKTNAEYTQAVDDLQRLANAAKTYRTSNTGLSDEAAAAFDDMIKMAESIAPRGAYNVRFAKFGTSGYTQKMADLDTQISGLRALGNTATPEQQFKLRILTRIKAATRSLYNANSPAKQKSAASGERRRPPRGGVN